MHQHDNLKVDGNVFGWGGNMKNRKQKREKSLIEVENWRDFGGVRYFLHELTKMQPLHLEKSFLHSAHETSISLTSRTHMAHEILPPPNHRENQEQYFSAFWIKILPYSALFFLFAFAIFHFIFSPASSYFLCSSNPCIFCYLFWFVVLFSSSSIFLSSTSLYILGYCTFFQ